MKLAASLSYQRWPETTYTSIQNTARHSASDTCEYLKYLRNEGRKDNYYDNIACF